MKLRKEDKYFLVPIEILEDETFRDLGPRAVSVYLFLANCKTKADYPSVNTMARKLKISSQQIVNALENLMLYNFVNEADLRFLGVKII